MPIIGGYLLSCWTSMRRLLVGLILCLALSGGICLVVQAEQPLVRVGDWRQTQGPLGATINALCIDAGRPNILYAATSAGLYLSSDGGDSWHLSTDVRLAAQEVLAVASAPSDPNRIYASTVKGQVFYSADGGEHWGVSSDDLPPKMLWALAVQPQNPALLYVGSDILYRSEDGGAHWTPLPFPVAGARISSIVLQANAPQALYVGTEKGIYKSEDSGQTWREASQGLPAGASVEALLLVRPSSSQLVLCAGTNKGIYRSTDGGTSWRPAAHGLAGAVSALAYSNAQPFILYGGFAARVSAEAWMVARIGNSSLRS
jgi:photosystem II stability/assembly factor-like uncharacterized protein